MYKRNAQPYNYTPDTSTASSASATARSPQPYGSSSTSTASTINITPRASQAYNAAATNPSTSTPNVAQRNTQTYSYNPGVSSSSSSSSSSSTSSRSAAYKVSWDFLNVKNNNGDIKGHGEKGYTSFSTAEDCKGFVISLLSSLEKNITGCANEDSDFTVSIKHGTQNIIIKSSFELDNFVKGFDYVMGTSSTNQFKI